MLSIQNLTHVNANGTRALDAATLDIPAGMFGLLGPNGAGKSTLMRCLATLQTPSSGAIRFADIDVLKEPERLRATLGYLPQDFGVYPRVSAYELLDHLAVLKGIADRGERRDSVEGRWETSFTSTITERERASIDAIVEAVRVRRDRQHARKRLAEIDAERARLLSIIAEEDADHG